MSQFLNQLASYGAVSMKPRSSTSRNADVAIRNRDNFASQARKQRQAMLTQPPKKGDWWKKHEDGQVTVCLRIGTATVNFGSGTHITVLDVPKALEFFDAAVEAAKSGELDQVLAASKVTKKKGGAQ